MEGWLSKASEAELRLIGEYLAGPGETCPRREPCRRLVQLAMASTAKFAVIPLQDIYCLGSQARINSPSTSDGKNWIWRMEENMLRQEVALWLRQLDLLYGRNTGLVDDKQEGNQFCLSDKFSS